MTPEDLLARFPHDPAKRGIEWRYLLPHKLACLEDETLRRLAATAWLETPEGKEWVAVQESYDPDERYP